ncbi:MAG: hypothetical protein QW247_06145 [Pyrobaculum sp.]
MIEVVAFVPAEVGICRTCDEVARAFKIRLTEEGLAEDRSADLHKLLEALAMVGPAPVRFTSPATLRGLYLMAKHRNGKLPLVLVGGRLVHSGPVEDAEALADKIRAALQKTGGRK